MYVYLDDILPEVEIDFDEYQKCEREVITPALEVAGYNLNGQWVTGDGDSFGPLSRCVRAIKDGANVTICYG